MTFNSAEEILQSLSLKEIQEKLDELDVPYHPAAKEGSLSQKLFDKLQEEKPAVESQSSVFDSFEAVKAQIEAMD